LRCSEYRGGARLAQLPMPEEPRRRRYVFISHSGKDTWVARQIAREIVACGATPFLDEAAVDAGSDFEEEILEFLEKAHEMVVLLTPWALDRPYIWAELGAAWGRRIPVVAILHGLAASEIQSMAGLPVLLKKRDMIELNEIHKYFDQLKMGREAGFRPRGL
jgi:hypothetical protein